LTCALEATAEDSEKENANVVMAWDRGILGHYRIRKKGTHVTTLSRKPLRFWWGGGFRGENVI